MVWYLLNLTDQYFLNLVNIRPYLLSKMSITMLLYIVTRFMSVPCVPIYGLIFRILTRFHTLYFGASCIHRNSIVWRPVILARFPYLLEKWTRRISWYSYLLETLISSEYGLTISGQVTVLRQWPLKKNTDYTSIIIKCTFCTPNFRFPFI